MTFLLCYLCYLGLLVVCLFALRKASDTRMPHQHWFINYSHSSEKMPDGVLVIAFWRCADSKCKARRATSARLRLTDAEPVTLPRPQ